MRCRKDTAWSNWLYCCSDMLTNRAHFLFQSNVVAVPSWRGLRSRCRRWRSLTCSIRGVTAPHCVPWSRPCIPAPALGMTFSRSRIRSTTAAWVSSLWPRTSKSPWWVNETAVRLTVSSPPEKNKAINGYAQAPPVRVIQSAWRYFIWFYLTVFILSVRLRMISCSHPLNSVKYWGKNDSPND